MRACTRQWTGQMPRQLASPARSAIAGGPREVLVRETRVNAPLFGLNIDPTTRDLDLIQRLTSLADEAGLDFVSIQDHPYIPHFLETWTLLTVLGARTQRVRLLPNVLCLPLRQPAVLAKSAATLDLLTGGRVELGLGTGAFWDGIAGYGGPVRTAGAAVDALAEALGVIRAIWASGGTGSVTLPGEHYALHDARPGPAPAHDIGIWLGAIGPRMQRLTGAMADGWIVSTGYVPPERVLSMQDTIDAAAREAGRDPATIRRAYNVSAVITAGDVDTSRVRPGTVVGSADDVAREIARFAKDLRMDTFLFRPGAGDVEQQAERFATQVVPRVRNLLA
jgi:alkanesulfonate monooxygenase SsuD/methylene tetrahydromethanopterin reductase-like flavin-dependent oxidoreductase (luciferase family)